MDPLDELLESLVKEQEAKRAEAGPSEADASIEAELEAAAEAAVSTFEMSPLEQRANLKKKVRELKQLLAVFLKAGKTLRLYSENHRYFDRFADEFMSRLGAQFKSHESLTFEITPFSMNWDGSVVFENREQRENLAFKLYRDGVRLLQFRRGVTPDEVRDFVMLIAREVDTKGSGKDLSVLFWEADFKHVHLAVAETFVEYSEEAARVLQDIEEDLQALQDSFELDVTIRERPAHEPEAFSQDSADQDVWGDATSDDEDEADATEMPVLPEASQDEERMLGIYEDLMGMEDPYATFEEVGTVLAEVVLAEVEPDDLKRLLRHLDDALSPLLATAAIGPLNSILRRLALIGRTASEREHFAGELIRDFFLRFCETDRLSLLARAIDDDWDDAWKGELFTFVSLQNPASVPELLGFLGSIRSLEPRRVITDSLVLLSGRNAAPFREALRSPRWRLAADAVHALGRIGDPTSLDSMMGAFSRDEHSLRVEVLNALKPYQSPRIQELMLGALRDDHEEVRLAALRYLAVYRVRDAIPELTGEMGRRDFSQRTFNERRGWFITLGHIAGPTAFTAFRRRVEPQRGRDDVTEEAHLALLGIKAIRGSEAQEFLQDFAAAAGGDLKLLVHKIIAGRKSS